MTAPAAARHPLQLERHGVRWTDDYAWLRDPGYPEVRDSRILAYLEAENARFRETMEPHGPFIDRLHAELKGRIKDDEASVPAPHGPWLYGWRFQAGAQYRSWYRWDREGGSETVILDETALASGKDYFNLRSLAISPDHRLLAYTTDDDGSEHYVVHIRNLETGGETPDLVHNTSGGVIWSADGSVLFYVELNENLRPFRVRAHRLGHDEAEDSIVYAEDDPAYFVSLSRTSDRRWIVIYSGTHVTREAYLVDARDPLAPPRPVAARRDGHRYDIDHAHGRFWILTNDRHINFRLVSAPGDDPGEAAWVEEIAPSDRHYLLDASCFAGFLVISERVDGLSNIRIRGYDGGSEHSIAFGEEVFTAVLGDNREFETDRLRLAYSSMVTPGTVYDYHVGRRELEVRKVQEIPSGYDPSLYETHRLWARAADGTAIPVSIVHRRDFVKDGDGPLYLYGYGSYGMSSDPGFNSNRLSLMERGFACAIAHVRGGSELGYGWYEDGKLAKKTNTFTDFIACAERLIEEGYARPGRIAIAGGSAGGMLMGAVVNMRPELFGAVVAQVPFVDVLNTMLDDTLPLTPIEWPEWGNPVASAEDFERIRSWSPYDNVAALDYPPMLVTAGISDPRVTYWEPAKWVARLRERRGNDSLLLLKTNMGAGHFGASGRFDSLKELAEVYTFVFKCLGILEGE